MNEIIRDLDTEMQKMKVIDTHEHLPPEEEIISTNADIFTRIYCQYSMTSVVSAGFGYDYDVLKNPEIPLEERWNMFKPYLWAIKDTGYARAAQIAARDLYDIEDINDHTYRLLSERIKEATSPGLYDRILKKKCNIEKILNQGTWVDNETGYSVPVCRDFMHLSYLNESWMRSIYEDLKEKHGGDFNRAKELVDFWLRETRRNGSVGVKFSAGLPTDVIEDAEAQSIFERFRNGKADEKEMSCFGIWIMHKVIESAPEHNLVVAIHCGLNWRCWADFVSLNPTSVVPLLIKYKNTVFDLYHGGIPWVREMAVIGNQYPNANLNLVWCHQISPYMTVQMLNEWIDFVPANKILGFGGDSGSSPEKTYGALALARENIARALVVRISRGEMTEERALDLCKAWFYDNPKRIYGC